MQKATHLLQWCAYQLVFFTLAYFGLYQHQTVPANFLFFLVLLIGVFAVLNLVAVAGLEKLRRADKLPVRHIPGYLSHPLQFAYALVFIANGWFFSAFVYFAFLFASAVFWHGVSIERKKLEDPSQRLKDISIAHSWIYTNEKSGET